jgi:hypothetical protein
MDSGAQSVETAFQADATSNVFVSRISRVEEYDRTGSLMLSFLEFEHAQLVEFLKAGSQTKRRVGRKRL